MSKSDRRKIAAPGLIWLRRSISSVQGQSTAQKLYLRTQSITAVLIVLDDCVAKHVLCDEHYWRSQSTCDDPSDRLRGKKNRMAYAGYNEIAAAE